MKRKKSVLDDAAKFQRELQESARKEAEERVYVGTGNYLKKIHCNGSGVHTSQIPAAIEAARKRGITIDFDQKGRPIFEDRSQRKKYLKMRGLNDMDGGYGDQTDSPCPYYGER